MFSMVQQNHDYGYQQFLDIFTLLIFVDYFTRNIDISYTPD